MAYDNNDAPQNTKHCILIDGDFGRHELFSDVHPYTLNRLGKSNDVLTFKTYTEQAMKLMNNASNIHYHIYYNSLSKEIDEYYKILKLIYPQSIWLHSSINTKTNNGAITLDYAVANCEHECNHRWIIHGIENHYEELIKQLNSTKNSKINISSYCWLENLNDGSNRIEYLFNNKIKTPIEEFSDQQVLGDSMTTESLEQNKRPKKKIICSFNGCKKKCKNANALNDHQLAKHPSIRPVKHEEPTSSTKKQRKTVIPKPKMTCDFDNCQQSYRRLRALQKHQLEQHPILLPCPFSEECLYSNEKYLGMFDLQTHILLQHAQSFSRQMCPIANCKSQKYWNDWSFALQHIIKRHSKYLFNASTPQTTSETTNTNAEQTKLAINIPSWDLDIPFRCSFNNCNRLYEDEEVLKRHEAFEHPLPFLCPFSSECQRSRKRYVGFRNLSNHVHAKHARQFPQPTCCDSECKQGEKKPFTTWNHVLRHILRMHMEAVGIIVTSTTSLTESKHKIFKKCYYDTCDQSFKTRAVFRYHLVTYHSFPLRCRYNSECNKLVHDSDVYLGLMELERHITTEHSKQFLEPMCFNYQCQKEKHFPDWSTVMTHILAKHWLDIRSN